MFKNESEGVEKAQLEKWQVVLYASFIAQMFSIIGFTASLPFIPLFLTRELNIPNAAEAGLWAGTMGTASALAMAGMAPIWGNLADRYGRKSMVLRAMIGGFVLIALMAICQDVWVLLVLRFLQGILTGTVPANIALIASQAPQHRIGYALGMMHTAIFAGSSIGPLVGGTLADLVGYRASFALTALGPGIAALIVVFFVHEDFKPVRPDPNAPKLKITQRLGILFSQKVFVAMLLILTLIQVANSVLAPVLALFVQELNGTIKGAATLAGLELGITGIASACSAAYAGKLSDRIGRRKVLIISALAASLLTFPQALVTNVWELMILRGLMGLFFGGIIPSATAMIAELTPEGRKGAAFGIVSSFASLGFAIGPIVGSLMAASLGTRAIFVLTGFILVATALWVNAVLANNLIAAKPLAEKSPAKPATKT